MNRRIREDVKQLLREPDAETSATGNRAVVAAVALVGAVAGATVGFLVVLLAFGFFGGGAQSGVPAILFGVPGGAWLGAELGTRKMRLR